MRTPGIFQVEPTTADLKPLFAGHRELRAVIEAVLEGRLGRTLSDSRQRPTVARLDLGCYSVFGGDPAARATQRLVSEVSGPQELVVAEASWRRCLLQLNPELIDRPMRGFEASQLRRDHLHGLAQQVPTGYSLRRLGADGARQLDRDLEPHALQTFAAAEAFVEAGLGFGVFRDDRLACAATTYAISSSRLEIAIATHPRHRRRGLALCAAARLAEESLRRGLEPCWNASNPVSQRLARRLGFRPAGVCEILFLEDPGRG